VIVYIWLPPYATVVVPEGEIVPLPDVTDDVIAYVYWINVADIVWAATTLVNV
jgi:hypothetical protein